MFSEFTEDAQKVMLEAKEEKEKLNHPFIGSEHLLLSILARSDLEITKQLKKYNLNYENFRNEIIKTVGIGKKNNKWFLYTPLLKKIIEGAIYDAKDHSEDKVSVLRLFLSLLGEGDGVAIRILTVMNVDIEALYDVFSSKIEKKKKYGSKKLLIEEYGIDFTRMAKNNEFDPIIGRDKEIMRLQEILIRKTKNNPILIGEAGVGKTALVEGLAQKIASGNVIKKLKDKRIISVSMANLVAGTKYRGEFEERINKMIKELEQVDDIILFIDEVHTLVGAGGAEGAIDASNILKPALARNKIKVIGATTNSEYTKYIEKDTALNRRFQKIEVMEPDYDKTKNILMKLKDTYEKYHNIEIDASLIDTIIELSNKYIFDRKQPDKAIDILDEACTKAITLETKEGDKISKNKVMLNDIIASKIEAIKSGDFDKASKFRKKQLRLENTINKLELDYDNRKTLTKKIIIKTIEDMTKIPISMRYDTNELNKIANKIKNRIIGQDNIVDEIMKETKNINLNQSELKSYLLVGSTGVGKTSLVEEYRQIFYKENFLKINMNEYKDSSSVNKLLGSPPGYIGYDSDNNVFEKIRRNPRTLILLENIDKASPVVMKVIMQILEDGVIDNAKGDEINFNNTVIFMTATIDNRNAFGYVNNTSDDILEKYFSKEFLAKIDKTFIFNDLKEKDIEKIVKNNLEKIRKKYLVEGIMINYTDNLITDIINDSNYKKVGASKINKIVHSNFNSFVLEEILDGKKEIKLEKIYT